MKKVKILSSTYTVKYVKDNSYMMYDENNGECDYSTKIIKVAQGNGEIVYSDKWQQETLHHELAHAFMYESGNGDLNDERHAELLGKFYDFVSSLYK